MITIDISKQALEYKGKSYSISTAKNGIGEIEDSYCTPTGKFKIAEKIGANLEFGSVLVDRESTGEIYNADLAKQYPDRDWILTRILWLDGVEVHNQNTKNRFLQHAAARPYSIWAGSRNWYCGNIVFCRCRGLA